MTEIDAQELIDAYQAELAEMVRTVVTLKALLTKARSEADRVTLKSMEKGEKTT